MSVLLQLMKKQKKLNRRIIKNKIKMKNKIITFVRENTWLNFREHGWGNGYAVVFKGHPAYGKDYLDIDVYVHGGLTYTDSVNSSNWDGLTEEMKDGWIVGFDTCHINDTQSNWSKKQVLKETENLKEQLEKMV